MGINIIVSKNHTDITHIVKKVQKNNKAKELLETSLRWTLLIAIFIIFSLLLNLYPNQENNKNLISQSQVLSVASSDLPARLIIPQINVSADIKLMGVSDTGEMEVPSNAADVGWFKIGVRPGEKGSAVIAGHLNGKVGEAGVFINLHNLKKGDKLYIEDNKGAVITFIVRDIRTYDPGHADDVFNQNDGIHLNLITCNGIWDQAKKNYSKRLVVFTDIIQ